MRSISYYCLGAILLPAIILGQTTEQRECTRDNSVTIQPQATAFLGSILSISQLREGDFACTPPFKYMQAVEAMRWALDLLNKVNETISTEFVTDYYVPGITLGMKLFDNCGGSKQAVASLLDIYPGLDGCSAADDLLYGIVGPTTSEDAKSVSMASQSSNTPLVSFQATDPDLTLTDLYPKFMRTIAPDNRLMEVVAEVLSNLNWKHIVIVYENSDYGRNTFAEVHRRFAEDAECCVAAAVVFDGDNLDDTYVDSILTSTLNIGAVGALYLGQDPFAKALIRRGEARMPESGQLQWLMMNIELDETFPMTIYQRGILSVTVASRFIVEFEDHWLRLNPADPHPENPWFREWYEMENDCSVTPGPGERDCATILGTGLTEREREQLLRANFVQNRYVEPAIMAIFTYANALRRAQMAKCPGTPGACTALRQMSRQEFFDDFLNTVDFTFTSDERVPSLASNIYEPYLAAKRLSFDDNGDIENPSYYIWNFNDIETGAGARTFRFRRVGTHINGNLDINLNNIGIYNDNRTQRVQPFPSSVCPATGCDTCLGIPADAKYFYEPGDVVIGGIFSLHDRGPEPFSCGMLKTHNIAMYVESMIYAIESINNDNTILPGIKLGGVGIDDCSHPAFGPAFISQVQRGILRIHKDGSDILDPLTIEAYVGAYDSPLTIPIAELMNSFKQPLVGYRAGSTELDDRTKYPYYVRAVQGISQEMKAIILMLKRFGWMHVQIAVSTSPYSAEAEKTFRELATKEGICIVARHEVIRDNYDAVVRGLSIGSPTPAVALLDTHEHYGMLLGLSRNQEARSRITLIATSRWGPNDLLVADLKSAAEGVLTLSPRRSTLATFQSYLRSLRYDNHDRNPWFDEWFSQVHNCNHQTCSTTDNINSGENFQVLYEVTSVINSVRAIAIAFDTLRSNYCGTGTTGLCSSFITAASKGEAFVRELRQVVFTIEDMAAPNQFRFSDSYVDIAFDIYNFRSGIYEVAGRVDPLSQVISVQNNIVLGGGRTPSAVTTTCASPCLECLYMFNFQDYLYVPGDLVIGAIFNIHYSGDGPFACGGFRVENGAVYSEVVKFAVDRINRDVASVGLDSGLRLGLLGFDGCSNPDRAVAILNRMVTDAMSIGPRSVSADDVVAWLTYDSETTEDSALFLQQLGIPLVSPGATAPGLADKDVYTTLFRTIPSDGLIVRGMAEFANSLGWRYVLVVNAPDDSSRQSADLFRTLLRDFGICVVARYEFETDGNMNVILNSLASFDTQVVAVFAEPDQYIDEFLAEKTRALIGRDLRFIANRRWVSESEGVIPDLENSVFFEMDSPTVSDFYTFLQGQSVVSSDNPWLSGIYEELFDCNLPGSFQYSNNCPLPYRAIGSQHVKDIWTVPTIHAVSAITEGLHRTLREKCGTSYTTVCSAFKHDGDTRQRFMFHMDQMSFTDFTSNIFRFIEREANRGVNFYRYRFPGTPTTEGTLSSAGILTYVNEPELRKYFVGVRSECPGECLICNAFDGNLQDYSFIPGIVYIVGLFDVHKKGATPFSCGEINDEHGMQLLEAFNYAIEYVNRGEGIFRDKLSALVLGGIGLDVCQSPARAANLVANIHSGNFEINSVNIRRIEAYIGTMDTESSIRVADILSQLQIPQISYGATGLDLLNMERYDYFLRSVPADDKQARAIISYLRKFEYNNIQIINSFDEIGEPGAEEFERLAQVNLVCVTRKYTFGASNETRPNEAQEIINQIVANSNGEVVVLWMKDPVPILQAAANNDVARSRILFVATDKWGANPSFLRLASIRRLLEEENLVILDVETADIPGFDRYLETKTPGNYTRNPWFREYFESTFSCVWEGPVRPGETLCNRLASIPRDLKYVQDPYVLYVINAVFSAAKAIDATVKEFCLTSDAIDRGICNLYRTSGERRQRVFRQMKLVNFVDDTHQPFFYTEDGQSDRGFHIYNVTEDPSEPAEFIYQHIGSYNDSDFLKLDIRYNSNYQARCDPDGNDPTLPPCTCSFEPFIPSRYMKKDNEGRGMTLAYIGDIHQPDPRNRFACGPINTGVDLQRLLAFFYAIDRINSNADLNLPDSIRLDGIALDSCSNGLRLGQDLYNLLSGNPLCDSDEATTGVSPSSLVGFVVDKDHNAVPVSSMLALEDIITISPTASSGALDDPFRHPYFLRTIGGNKEQANAIVELVKSNQWNLFSVVYTDSPTHQSSVDDLLARAQGEGICVSQTASLSSDATLDDAREALNQITQQNGMRAIVLFLDPAHIRLLMEASRELRLAGQYVWIFPASWDSQMADFSTYESELKGSILIQHRSGILEDFIDYMTQMNYTNRLGIPNDWFEEIYETLHQCNIFNRQGRPSVRHSTICTQNEVITRDMITPDLSVLHVVLSVYSVALGLNNIPQCSGNIDIAACLQLEEEKIELIYKGIRDINWRPFPGELGNRTFDLTFDINGNGQAGYNIQYYTTTDAGRFVTVDLGTYTTTGLSNIDWAEYRRQAFRIDESISNVLASNCPLSTICTCQAARSGAATSGTATSGAATWQLRTSGSSGFSSCEREGEILSNPDTGESFVLERPGLTDRFEDTWAIIVTVLAAVGGFVALVLFIYLLVMYPVRGGTSILGYILSFGIILLYLMVFPFIYHVDERLCSLRRFGLGLVYSIVYSALLVKLVDCWRVRGKNDSYSAKYSKLGRPTGLFFITAFLVLVQVMINAEWLILEPPEVDCVVYRNSLWPRCAPEDFADEGLVLSLVYIMVLIVFSFFLGIITFTSLQNHKEPRWILAIFALTIPCWVIWCLVTILGAVKVRDAAVAVGLLVNATIILIFVPIRKLYLLSKYNALIEEEDKLANEADYNSTYGHQYDNRPRMHDTGSVRGSTVEQRTYTGSGTY